MILLDGFNPKLVRLRRSYTGARILRAYCFNPTLVRLRLMKIVGLLTGVLSFNPTLVRLRRSNASSVGVS